MIELDMMHFDLLELAPLSEYELYIRAYGKKNMSQVAVQSADDRCGNGNQGMGPILRVRSPSSSENGPDSTCLFPSSIFPLMVSAFHAPLVPHFLLVALLVTPRPTQSPPSRAGRNIQPTTFTAPVLR